MSIAVSTPMPVTPFNGGPCAACGAGMRAGRAVGPVNGHQLHRCEACGLAYVFPKPTSEALDSLYDGFHTDTGQMDLSESGERELFEHVLDRVHASSGSGELLDIGASYGHFVALAGARGFVARGIEPAADAARYAGDVLRVDVGQQDLFTARFPAGRFDAVTLLNVLEHMPDPYAALREIRRITRPGGVLAVVVPSLVPTYWWFRATRAIGLLSPVPTSAFHVPYHLTLFSPRTLAALLESAGLEVAELTAAPVIINRNPIKTVAKRVALAVSDGLQALTAGRFIISYSIFALARRPIE
ncbi:MAG: methyltransferase domain-containing protein [Vicinamibacterales bacterium]